MRKRLLSIFSLGMIAALVLGACATPTPAVQTQIVRETSVVVETQIVEVKETQIVTQTEVVAATPEPGDVVYDREETLYVSGAAWGPPTTWNPFQPGNLANSTGTIGFVYEFLYSFDPVTGELTPWLAESGEWTTPTTYQVVLRDGLTWSDGEALTAADVKFTYELGQNYAAIWFSPMWAYLTGITAVDDVTIEFAFTDAPLYQEFTNNLYNIPIVPEHLWAGRSEEDITVGANEGPVGSGAYLYDTHGEDRSVWLRNENWWGIAVFGTPAPRRIVDIRTSSNNVALGMVLQGQLDLSNNFLPGVAALADQGYVDTYFEGAPYMLAANTAVLFLNTTKPPMNDPAFRRALAFAIDTPSIVNVAYARLVGAASPTGLLPSLSQYVDQAVVDELGYSFNTDTAKQMLADAGYVDVDGDGFVEAPDGSKIELQVTCPSGWTDWMAAIDIIASSAQAAGINIADATPDYGAWNTELQGGTFDMTLNNWAAMSNTPWTLYNLLFRHPIQEQMQSGNFGRYDNPVMFDLVDELAHVPADDVAGMQAITSQIQELMLTDLPMIPLWYNGLWSQYSTAVWTNWPAESAEAPKTLPTTWSGYWQLGGLLTLINLQSTADQASQ